MALALYRKYRPRTFSEVIGQDHVTEPLIQALSSGRLNHAYLFSGPRGCGKTSSARILARSLNCAQGPTPDPCGECESCRALAPDGPGSIDVIEIDAASHGGVDDARELRERAFFAPAVSRYKIYIIDEAHMVSSAGFNALLKLVEEPPDYVKFVFATTEPEKVLGTIKSRTHHYPFRLIPPNVMRPHLEQLATAEGIKVEAAVLPLVVRAGGGSVRDTQSVFDQLIAGSGPEGVTYAMAVSLLGVTDVALINEMVDALAAGDGGAAFGTIDQVADAGHDSRRFAGDLLQRFRDLIILRQLPEAAERGLLDAQEDELTRMSAQAGQLGQATLSRFADIVHNGLVEMRGATSPRLLLELIVARMLLPVTDESVSAVLQRLERLEQGHPPSASSASANPPGVSPQGAARAVAARAAAGARDSTPPAPASTTPAGPTTTEPAVSTGESPAAPAPVAAPARPVAAPPSQPEPDGWSTAPAAETVAEPDSPDTTPQPAAGADAASVRRAWDEIVRTVGHSSKKAAAFALEAVVREVEGDTLVLLFKHKVHADGVTRDPAPLLEAVHQVIGGRWNVRCEIGGDQRPSAGRARQPTATTPRPSEAWPTPAAAGGATRPRVPSHDTAPAAARAARPGNRVGDGPRLEGFDPGDEPDTDTDSLAVRQTSEQQALESLRKSFDLEKIAETGS